MYAESLLIYRLVKLQNTISVKFPLVAKKLNEGNHSLAGFSNFVAKTMIDRYEYLCTNDPCLPCGRLQCIDISIFYSIILSDTLS